MLRADLADNTYGLTALTVVGCAISSHFFIGVRRTCAWQACCQLFLTKLRTAQAYKYGSFMFGTAYLVRLAPL